MNIPHRTHCERVFISFSVAHERGVSANAVPLSALAFNMPERFWFEESILRPQKFIGPGRRPQTPHSRAFTGNVTVTAIWLRQKYPVNLLFAAFTGNAFKRPNSGRGRQGRSANAAALGQAKTAPRPKEPGCPHAPRPRPARPRPAKTGRKPEATTPSGILLSFPVATPHENAAS
jgi:hypothetical protein